MPESNRRVRLETLRRAHKRCEDCKAADERDEYARFRAVGMVCLIATGESAAIGKAFAEANQRRTNLAAGVDEKVRDCGGNRSAFSHFNRRADDRRGRFRVFGCWAVMHVHCSMLSGFDVRLPPDGGT